MAGMAGMLRVSVDYHRHVGAIYVMISYEKDDWVVDKIRILVAKTEFVLTLLGEEGLSFTSRYPFQELVLHPPTCCALTGQFVWAHQESEVRCSTIESKNDVQLEECANLRGASFVVCFRVQAESQVARNLSSVDTPTSDCSGDTFHHNVQSIAKMDGSYEKCTGKPPLKVKTSYRLLCRSCGYDLQERHIQLSKIASLPSKDWVDAASEWYCHNHEMERECVQLSNIAFIPKACELFVSTLHYRLNGVWLKPEVVQGQLVHCTRCLSTLGNTETVGETREERTVNFLKQYVLFQEPCTQVNCTMEKQEDPNNSVVVMLLKQMLVTAMACKVCLETQKDALQGTNISLLLWVMDRDMLHFDSISPVKPADKELLHMQPVKMENVMKVLYSTVPRNSKRAKQWHHDFDVDVQEIEESIFLAVLNILIQSSRAVPPTLRIVDEFMVGFLSLNTPNQQF